MSNKRLEFNRGDVIAEKYEVVDLLDQNPFGLLYRVKHLKSGKYVRLTMLREEIAGRDQKEEVIAAFTRARDIQHSNLMRVGELSDHNGIGYYVMEDFEGSTLRELMQEYRISGHQFTLREAAQITIQILEGLEALHNGGLTFRALRPEYVLVRIRHTGPRQSNVLSQVKLVGGGFWDLISTATLAEDEFSRGEAQYLAPELKSFNPRPDPRSDLYSTVVMFYEMLVGVAPVGTFQLPRQRRPDLPLHVDGIVEVGLAIAPDDRFPTARDLISNIQRTFQDASLDPMDHRVSLHPAVWALMALAVVAVAVILFNWREDPLDVATALDATLRAEIAQAQALPSQAEVRAILVAYPENMMYIPESSFLAGRLHQEFDAPRSEPSAIKIEQEAFLIDLFEFPNQLNAPSSIAVTYKVAEESCEAAGKRLCTATEWEKACKGPGNYIYSYGDTFDQDFCGLGLEDTYRSGAREACKSGWNVFDLSGNYQEWTSTAPDRNPGRRLVKGGQRQQVERGTRCAYRVDYGTGYLNETLGFRCCMDFDPNGPPTAPEEPEPNEETPPPEE